MRISRIPEGSKAVSHSIPRFLAGTNGKAVLLLHGFNSFPSILDYLGARLHSAGYTVAIPRLPGHGTNATDFMNSSEKEWLRHAADSYMDLKAEYDDVFIGGLSMGGLLALILASRFRPRRIALASPAIMNTDWRIKIAWLLKLFIRRLPSGFHEETDDPDLQYLYKEYKNWDRAAPVSRLYRLQKLGRARMKLVVADTMVIVSTRDTAVPVEVANYITTKISSKATKQVVLTESGHESVIGEEKERVADEFIKWFDGRYE